jgi:hypothetical protein
MSRVAGQITGKHTYRDPATNRFAKRPAAAPPAEPNPEGLPVTPAPRPVSTGGPDARPSAGALSRRLLTGSLRDILRG